jgi:hypothetical protein
MPFHLNTHLNAMIVLDLFTADIFSRVEWVSHLEKTESPLSFAPVPFSFMERHPEVEFGTPARLCIFWWTFRAVVMKGFCFNPFSTGRRRKRQ